MSLRDELLDAIEESCAVALPMQRNCATSQKQGDNPDLFPKDWLRLFLLDHIVPVPAVLEAATQCGLLWSDIAMAAEELMVRVLTSDGKKYWAMPQKRLKSNVPRGRLLTMQPTFEPPPWIQ